MSPDEIVCTIKKTSDALTVKVLKSQSEEEVEQEDVSNCCSYPNPVPIRVREKST